MLRVRDMNLKTQWNRFWQDSGEGNDVPGQDRR